MPQKSFPPIVGVRIRQAREEADLSQDALGHKIGVTGRTVGNWEGARNAPDAFDLANVAGVTKKDLSWFYGDESPTPHSGNDPVTNGADQSEIGIGDTPMGDTGGPHPPFDSSIVDMIDSVEYRAGDGEAIAVPVGISVRDRRRAPRLADGSAVSYFDAIAPSDAHRKRGIEPGAELDIQPHEGFEAAGLYVVAFADTPDIYYVTKTPSDGFVFRNDEERFRVEPRKDSPSGYVDLESQEPATFRFMARLLSARRTYSMPRSARKETKQPET